MPIGTLYFLVVKYASVETLNSYIIYPLHVVKSDIEFDSAISSFVYAKGTIVTVLISEFEINMVVAISVICAGLCGMNIQNDYYNAACVYPNIRLAISIMNPTVKN